MDESTAYELTTAAHDAARAAERNIVSTEKLIHEIGMLEVGLGSKIESLAKEVETGNRLRYEDAQESAAVLKDIRATLNALTWAVYGLAGVLIALTLPRLWH